MFKQFYSSRSASFLLICYLNLNNRAFASGTVNYEAVPLLSSQLGKTFQGLDHTHTHTHTRTHTHQAA